MKELCLRVIWNAIFYLVKTGCQWRMLPLDFPKWQLVYYYYRKWASQLDFDLLLEKLRGHVCVKRGQSMEPCVGIMDSQSVKWVNTASLNGVDGNKKVKGIKRHVVVDKNGFLIAVMVTIANVHDSKAGYLLMKVLKEMSSGVKTVLADGGYRGELVDSIRKKFGYVIQVVISAYKEQGFRPIQKRWVVERTFSWMDYNRRLCRNHELTFDSAEEMVNLATIRLLLRNI